jgi:hypothetical protein
MHQQRGRILYILWKERQGRRADGNQEEIQLEEEGWSERIKKEEHWREELREYLRKPSSAGRKKKIINISLEDMEKELTASDWKPKPEDRPAHFQGGVANVDRG